MRWNFPIGSWAFCRVFAAALLVVAHGLRAQEMPVAPSAKPPSDSTLDALFLSDIHFEPFFDPGKVLQLADAPVTGWKVILAAPASPDREQRFAALQKACRARGEDTDYTLFDSSLRAIEKNAAAAKFATISGDLISHAFSCKFETLFPKAAPGEYRAFVEKTLSFVVDELHSALPGVPVYVALGNNDSDCGDYQLDAHSDFLASAGDEVTKGFPALERKAAREEYAAGGYMSVALPMRDARLLVLDDQFMSSKYVTCGGKPDESAADAQIAWLGKQLKAARRNKEKIWVMAHIPPGVDVHASAAHLDEVCGEQGPRLFLGSEKMADVLTEYGDVIELVLFAHTHMDELRILRADNAAAGASKGSGVAVKMVSSISPINGNAPSFTLAQVDAATAKLKNFQVFAASNKTGVDATWAEEYDWDKTYGQGEFSAATVSRIVAGFKADPAAKSEASQAYIKDFNVGASPLLRLVWPQYVCSLDSYSAQSFKACVCPAGK